MSDSKSESLFYTDDSGNKSDKGLHDETPEQNAAMCEWAVENAIREGMDPIMAHKRFGIQPKERIPFRKK